MKRIAFVTPWFGEKIPGGAEMELRGIANHIADTQDIEVEILTTTVKEFLSDWSIDYYKVGSEKIGNLTVRRFKVRKRDTKTFDAVNYKLMHNEAITVEEENIYLKEMVNSTQLYSYIRNHKDEYDLFIFIPYMFGTTYYGSLQCLDKAILIPCFHDESYIYINKYKSAFENVAGMIYHATPEYKLANRVFDFKGTTQAVLGEGVDTDFEFNADNFRKKFNIDSPFILYAGRKDKGKQVDLLLEYFEKYKSNHKGDLKLVLIGGGQIDIPRKVKDDVIDLGFVDIQDKYDAYAAALCTCQPSSHESFSLVIMESWLAERPVIVNEDCNVTADFAKKTGAGLYFANYNDFEGAVNYYLEHEDVAKEMGKAGREYVIENFSWPQIVKKYVEFFEKVIEEHD